MTKRNSRSKTNFAQEQAAHARRLRAQKETSTDPPKPNPYARLMAKIDAENAGSKSE